MDKQILSPFDCDMCAMIEDLTKQSVTVEASTEHIRISWEQPRCERTSPEGQRNKAIKQAVAGRLGERLIAWEYKDGRQNAFIEYDPEQYPEEIRTALTNGNKAAGSRYCRTLKEVDAVLFTRDNLEAVQAFTGGGTIEIPRTPDGLAKYSFTNPVSGLFTEVVENWYIVREKTGQMYPVMKIHFERDFEPKGYDYERCENCEKQLETERMLHDREGVPLCPECVEALKGDPDFELVGVIKIKEERESQIYDHGFDVSHDKNTNPKGELKNVVVAILTNDPNLYGRQNWDWAYWEKIKAKPELEQLAICGAMIAAEIDRVTYNAMLNQPKCGECSKMGFEDANGNGYCDTIKDNTRCDQKACGHYEPKN